MNRYIVAEITEQLTVAYLISNEVRTHKRNEEATNLEIVQLHTRMIFLEEKKSESRRITNGKISSLSNRNLKAYTACQSRRNDVITKLKKLREKTQQYQGKVRNLKKQIPSPDDIIGAYADRPAQISALQVELDNITKEMDVIDVEKIFYRILSMELNNGYYYPC